jgi:hypothetical protein
VHQQLIVDGRGILASTRLLVALSSATLASSAILSTESTVPEWKQGCSQGANSFIVDRRHLPGRYFVAFLASEAKPYQLVDRLGCS